MQLPTWLKPGIYGVILGGIATVVIGFSWGGWVTGGKAQDMADNAAQTAKTNLVASLCVEKFEATPNAQAQLTKLKKTDSWDQSDFVKKGGWSTIAGIKNVSGVADACANDLASLKQLPTPVAMHTTTGTKKS